MQTIDRAGTFKGTLKDWGVNATKNGYPQFVAKFLATEFYDATGELTGGDPGYVNWTEYNQEIDGYLCLYTKDKKTGAWVELQNSKQLKAVLGWSGLDYESLAGGDYSGVTVMFRVEENEYEGTTSLKVQWLDKADANPLRQLSKFDTNKLKNLTASMGGALSQNAAPVAPAKAPASAPATPPKRGPGRPKAATPAATPAPASAAVPPAAPSTVTPPPASPAPASPAPSAPPAQATPETKDSAWAAVNSTLGVTEEKLAEVWIAEATKIGKPEDQFTSDDWKKVKDAVWSQTSKF